MNVGVLGGTFNPPHIGHLILAQCALEELALDSVLFVPAYISPFKAEQPAVDAELRCEMVELAIVDHPRFVCERCEVERRSVSYTVDTLAHLRATRPDDALTLILGADTFADFPRWRAPDDIARMARFAVAARGGTEPDLAAHPFAHAATVFAMPRIDVSASSVRARAGSGRSIRYVVPWTVKTFIEAHGLYRAPAP